MYDLCIHSGMIVKGDEKFKGNLYIKDGKIAAIDSSEDLFPAEKLIDADGKLLLPGFIDPHSHLNDPGLTESEDFYTGTLSAAAGGITTVLEHPLTFPSPNCREVFADKKRIADSKTVVDFALFGACTPTNYDQIHEMIDEGAVAFKAFMPYSPEIPNVTDMELLRHMENLKSEDVVLCIHCENNNLVESFTAHCREEGKTAFTDYEAGRPEVAEIEAVNRVAVLAQWTGGKVHVVHCTSPTAVNTVNDFRGKGTNISVETCPHYIYFKTEDLAELGAFGICNPPLRSQETVNILREQLKNGEIGFVGSDHATYTFEEKLDNGDVVFDIPAGVTGIETCFPILFDEVVHKLGMSVEEFARLSSIEAAKRFRLYPQKGSLEIGTDADMVIYDPDLEWTVDAKKLEYKMKWTPYDGRQIKGKALKTIVRGQVVYSDGACQVEPGFGAFVRPIVEE